MMWWLFGWVFKIWFFIFALLTLHKTVRSIGKASKGDAQAIQFLMMMAVGLVFIFVLSR